MSRIRTTLVVAAFALPAAWAHAASMAGEPTAGTEVQAGAPAIAGGVGLNARDALRSQTPKHNVKMVFSLTTGNYLADVSVKVTGAGGKTVLEGVSDGPWLYAQLPSGSYTVRATYNGNTVTKKISAGKGTRTAHFRWPPSVEQRAEPGVSQILGTGPQEGPR